MIARNTMCALFQETQEKRWIGDDCVYLFGDFHPLWLLSPLGNCVRGMRTWQPPAPAGWTITSVEENEARSSRNSLTLIRCRGPRDTPTPGNASCGNCESIKDDDSCWRIVETKSNFYFSPLALSPCNVQAGFEDV
jgi:hypothetical protein